MPKQDPYSQKSLSTGVAGNLAKNMTHLRLTRGLSQQALAKLSGIPRPTLAHLESGSANPTLLVLHSLAHALQISIEELITKPRGDAQLFRESELRTRIRGGSIVRKILPESSRSFELETLELMPSEVMAGMPHREGTREYFHCLQGRFQIVVSSQVFEILPRQVLAFRGDQKHSYKNLDKGRSIGISAVLIHA